MIWWQVFVGFVVGLVLFWLSHRRGVHEERRRWIAYPNIMRELYAAERSFESNAPVITKLGEYTLGVDPAYDAPPTQFVDPAYPFQTYEHPGPYNLVKLKTTEKATCSAYSFDGRNGSCRHCGRATYWDERDCEHMKLIGTHPCNKEGRSPEQFAADMNKLLDQP